MDQWLYWSGLCDGSVQRFYKFIDVSIIKHVEEIITMCLHLKSVFGKRRNNTWRVSTSINVLIASLRLSCIPSSDSSVIPFTKLSKSWLSWVELNCCWMWSLTIAFSLLINDDSTSLHMCRTNGSGFERFFCIASNKPWSRSRLIYTSWACFKRNYAYPQTSVLR